MSSAIPLPAAVITPAHWCGVQSVMWLALTRASYILAAKSDNELRITLEALVRRCRDKVATGESFCECIVTNRSSFTTSDFVYSYCRARLQSAIAPRPTRKKGNSSVRERILLDADVPATGTTGIEIVRWIYRELLDRVEGNLPIAQTLPGPASATLKDLRKLLLGISNADIILMLPPWTEDIIFRPPQLVQRTEEALLYTLIDIVNELRINDGGTGGSKPTSWSVMIFLSTPHLIAKASQKVKSRLGLAMTYLDTPLSSTDCADYVRKMTEYTVNAYARLPESNHSAKMELYIEDYLSALGRAIDSMLRQGFKYHQDRVTISPAFLIKTINSALITLIKYDPTTNTMREPREWSLVHPTATAPEVICPTGPAGGRGRHRPQRRLEVSPEPASTKKFANKRTSALTPILNSPQRSHDAKKVWPSIESLFEDSESRLRVIFWRHLALIDLCVLLAWVNLHSNQKMTYICGLHLTRHCQPATLSSTAGAWVHLNTEAILHSIHYLLRTRVLLVSQAQVVVEAPEASAVMQVVESSEYADASQMPFLEDPLIFPMWEHFATFLKTMRAQSPQDFPSWLTPRTDGRME